MPYSYKDEEVTMGDVAEKDRKYAIADAFNNEYYKTREAGSYTDDWLKSLNSDIKFNTANLGEGGDRSIDEGFLNYASPYKYSDLSGVDFGKKYDDYYASLAGPDGSVWTPNDLGLSRDQYVSDWQGLLGRLKNYETGVEDYNTYKAGVPEENRLFAYNAGLARSRDERLEAAKRRAARGTQYTGSRKLYNGGL